MQCQHISVKNCSCFCQTRALFPQENILGEEIRSLVMVMSLFQNKFKAVTFQIWSNEI